MDTDGTPIANGDSVALLPIEDAEFIRTTHKLSFNVGDKFYALVVEFNDIFSTKPGLAKVSPVRIPISPDARPIRELPRAKNKGRAEREQRYVDEQVAIKSSEKCPQSPWAFNLVLAAKKDTKEERPCIDLRRFNELVPLEAYPMPKISDILMNVSRGKVFSTFDFVKGFHQIPIDKRDRHYFAYYSPDGNLMQCVTVPFGYKNAPSEFQRVMNQMLDGLLGRCALVYLDDVTIFSKDVEEHMVHLREFFEAVRKIGTTISPKKIQPFRTEIKLLGHIISKDFIKPDPAKIEGIIDFPRPKNKKQTQSFLGSVNYYRNFVGKIALVTAPLYKITGKNVPFSWGEAEQTAFERSKFMMKDIILHTPDLTKPFVIHTDACIDGLRIRKEK